MANRKRWTKLDPSRTKTERQRFMNETKRRFKALADAIVKLVVTDDAFGLDPKEPFMLAVQNRRQYAFLSNPQKVQQFRQWLQQQVDANVLEVIGGKAGQPWTAQYVISAWRKGMMRSYTDVRKQDVGKSLDWYAGTKEQWLRSAFLQPEMMSKVEMLATRAFEGMKGVTDQVSTQLSRILSDGLVGGYGVKKVAKQMTDAIGSITRKRALVIARTEIIHAHAEGQLDGLAQLGVKEVTAEVEWSTAGDGLVCEECAGMEGQTFAVKDAHNMIPLHPNCRCAWLPVVETAKSKSSHKQ